MYCCIMPSVPLNKDSIKLEEINQNDSGISPSYCSGDSRGSDHLSPGSSTEECSISTSTPLNLSDHKSPQPVATSQQLSLFRNLSFASALPPSPTGTTDTSKSPLTGASNGGVLLRISNGGVSNGASHVSNSASNGASHRASNCGASHIISNNSVSNGTSHRISNCGASNGTSQELGDKLPASPRFNFHDSISPSMSPASSLDSNDYQDREHPLQQLALVVKRNEMLVPTQPETAETNSSDKTLIHCPLCNYTTNSRTTFNSHLHSHEGQKCCYICELMTETVEQLREHYQSVHDVNVSADFLNHSSGGEEEPGITVPKLNSQGKVKKHRCKQCGIVCVTKLEFWEHCRGHIKQERLLTCPKCPFVTEYKHHLEYHLRNHFGSKPFKCSKCSYSCVNKSMLNSHLKSHSNVYQFRCNDCSYATKYCHSLKLHLRKYKHTPAMVLNPDGSPNPLPIVDVYGTRRGPKQRPKKHSKNALAMSPYLNQTQLTQSPFSNQTQLTQFSNQTQLTQSPFSNQTQLTPTPFSNQTQLTQTSFSNQTQFTPTSTYQSQFLSAQTQRPTSQTTFSPAQTTFSPTRSSFSPAQTLSPTQARFSPKHSPTSPPPSQAQFPSNLHLSSQTPYSVFPSNYGLFPSFPYPLVPNTIPFPSLSLLQLDIPALLEEAKRSAETLEKLKQLLQSNNNNSQYISKAVAQQIIDDASKPSTPPCEFSTAPLDLSKPTHNEGYSDNQTNNMNSPSVGSNRRKGKAVKRVAIPSMYSEDSDSERRSPVHFGATSLMAGAQRIY